MARRHDCWDGHAKEYIPQRHRITEITAAAERGESKNDLKRPAGRDTRNLPDRNGSGISHRQGYASRAGTAGTPCTGVPKTRDFGSPAQKHKGYDRNTGTDTTETPLRHHWPSGPPVKTSPYGLDIRTGMLSIGCAGLSAALPSAVRAR